MFCFEECDEKCTAQTCVMKTTEAKSWIHRGEYEWLCIQWGGVVVYSLEWSGCVFSGVEWLCIPWGGVVAYSLWWCGCVFTGVE